MVQDRSRVEPIAERIGPEAFRDPVYSEIFSALLETEEDATLDDLSAVLEPDAIVLMQEMLGEDGALVNVQRTIDDSITRLHVRDMEERVAEIDRLLPIANEVEKDALQEERAKLVVQMRASGRMTYKAFRPGRTR
jgi:replicative DNA helicase